MAPRSRSCRPSRLAVGATPKKRGVRSKEAQERRQNRGQARRLAAGQEREEEAQASSAQARGRGTGNGPSRRVVLTYNPVEALGAARAKSKSSPRGPSAKARAKSAARLAGIQAARRILERQHQEEVESIQAGEPPLRPLKLVPGPGDQPEALPKQPPSKRLRLRSVPRAIQGARKKGEDRKEPRTGARPALRYRGCSGPGCPRAR